MVSRFARSVLLAAFFLLGFCACREIARIATPQISDEQLRSSVERSLRNGRKALADAHTPYDRWLALTQLVVWEAGSEDETLVRGHVDELLKEAPQYRHDWNYGNAVHKGNLALGRLSLRHGDLVSAGQYLLEAGKTPGSPQLDSFGPNMLLARELFARGERTAILQYFDLCRRFWQMGGKDLDEWTAQVKAGAPPNFGANLLY